MNNIALAESTSRARSEFFLREVQAVTNMPKSISHKPSHLEEE
jgi:hypothetical protein